FIVAYQTISDYLDNLCDRSTSQCPKDFDALHQAMGVALSPHRTHSGYYHFREEKDDGGYLASLVECCQRALRLLGNYAVVSEGCLLLQQWYADLQVHKHVIQHERLERLQKWFAQFAGDYRELKWNEFAAASGSTLGIFALVSYAAQPTFSNKQAKEVVDAYFPYVQGLHILLDYVVDEEEDKQFGDLNFITYYNDETEVQNRMLHFLKQALQSIQCLSNTYVHKYIIAGLVSVYMSDEKMQTNKMKKQLLQSSGFIAYFFYYNRIALEFIRRKRRR
ncbi:MAG: DUF2600 family protein, partial [Bacilli bacterium]